MLGAVICMGGTVLLCVYRGVSLTNTRDITSHGANSTMSNEKTQNWVAGSMLLMASCLMFSSWFLVQAKIGNSYPCKYSSTAILTLFAAIQSALVSLVFERDIGMWVLKGNLEILSVIYSVSINLIFKKRRTIENCVVLTCSFHLLKVELN